MTLTIEQQVLDAPGPMARPRYHLVLEPGGGAGPGPGCGPRPHV